ncbi:MAG TPA: hypothetical protein VKB52_00320 [Rhodanobacteraceae bacterium]|nr:hypothetical protein [Rhodanobacteraceae bacterium]
MRKLKRTAAGLLALVAIVALVVAAALLMPLVPVVMRSWVRWIFVALWACFVLATLFFSEPPRPPKGQ